MFDHETKPLNWDPEPGIGYTVTRRLDGGMNFIFTDLSHLTLEHWRAFALAHLLDSDRLTRNLYDLRKIKDIPEEAIEYAIEVNTDPAVRNIRLAVVVGSDETREAIQQIDVMTVPSGVDMAIFTDIDEAEAWLDRPLTLLM